MEKVTYLPETNLIWGPDASLSSSNFKHVLPLIIDNAACTLLFITASMKKIKAICFYGEGSLYSIRKSLGKFLRFLLWNSVKTI